MPFPISLLPGSTDDPNAPERVSFPELLAQMAGAGLAAGGHPLGAALSVVGDVLSKNRQGRDAARSQQQIATIMSGDEDASNQALQRLATLGQLDPDTMDKIRKAREQAMADKQFEASIAELAKAGFGGSSAAPGVMPASTPQAPVRLPQLGVPQPPPMPTPQAADLTSAPAGGEPPPLSPPMVPRPPDAPPLQQQQARPNLAAALRMQKSLYGKPTAEMANTIAEQLYGVKPQTGSGRESLYERWQDPKQRADVEAYLAAQAGQKVSTKREELQAAQDVQGQSKNFSMPVRETLVAFGVDPTKVKPGDPIIHQAEEGVDMRKARSAISTQEKNALRAAREANQQIVELRNLIGQMQRSGIPLDPQTLTDQKMKYAAMKSRELGYQMLGSNVLGMPGKPYQDLFTKIGIVRNRLALPYLPPGMRAYNFLRESSQHLPNEGEPIEGTLNSLNALQSLIPQIINDLAPSQDPRRMKIIGRLQGQLDPETGRKVNRAYAEYLADKLLQVDPSAVAAAFQQPTDTWMSENPNAAPPQNPYGNVRGAAAEQQPSE